MNKSLKLISDLVVHTKYSRYLPYENRRETWKEIVDRNKEFHKENHPKLSDEIEAAYKYVYEKRVLPSMRSMQFAGEPINKMNSRIYNCSFLHASSHECFSEILYLLLGGTGVGYSVQKHHVAQMHPIKKHKDTVGYVISDSIEGWSNAVDSLFNAYVGNEPVPIFDYSKIRKKGTPLVTSGGKAPGPEPLRIALCKIIDILEYKNSSKDNKLSTLNVHDIICLLADCVLAGGIRRSACIALFSPSDEEMLNCKGKIAIRNLVNYSRDNINYFSFETNEKKCEISIPEKWNYMVESFYKETGCIDAYWAEPQRGRSNNSVVLLRDETTQEQFYRIMKVIELSGNGEPGIFWTNSLELGTNPCGEISLQNMQFCNLTTINGGSVASQEDLNNVARVASFIGTLQASYTDFDYLRNDWEKTTRDEALLGVSITGIASGNLDSLNLTEAANCVVKENERVSAVLGIKPSYRLTTIKPEGTSSLVLGTSSGIHAWHDNYYIRTLRLNKKEPIYEYLKDIIPELIEDDFQNRENTSVLNLPAKSPNGSKLRHESALTFLERVSRFYNEWILPGHIKGENTHNVSCTVNCRDNEWEGVTDWMWKNRNNYSAISLLPYSDAKYEQQPFDTCSRFVYEMMTKVIESKDINLSDVKEYTDENNFIKDTVACAGGQCSIV